MTAITLHLHLPDDLAARVAALPPDEVNATAVAALADLVSSSEPGDNGETGNDVVSAEEAAFLAPGIRRGLQAAIEGRERPLAEYAAEFEARHGSSRHEAAA